LRSDVTPNWIILGQHTSHILDNCAGVLCVWGFLWSLMITSILHSSWIKFIFLYNFIAVWSSYPTSDYSKIPLRSFRMVIKYLLTRNLMKYIKNTKYKENLLAHSVWHTSVSFDVAHRTALFLTKLVLNLILRNILTNDNKLCFILPN